MARDLTGPPSGTEATPPAVLARAAQGALARGTGSPALDRLAELAARLLGTPSAQVSLVSDVQTIAGGAGLGPDAVGSRHPLDDSLCQVTISGGAPLVVTDAAIDDRVSGLPPVTSGTVAAYLGVPLAAEGRLIGELCVFDAMPRLWTDTDVTLLEELAAPVVAELELARLTADYKTVQVIWELAIDAAGVGAFDWNLATGELTWDYRLLQLFGLDRDTFGGTIEAFNAALHPDDVLRVTDALNDAIENGGDYAMEYRVALPGGGVRWVTARGRALPDASGTTTRMIGAAFDTTAVQEGEARIARVLEAMPSAFFNLDRSWRFTYANAEAERLLGLTRHELVGDSIWELFPHARGSEFETRYRRAAERGQPELFEAYYPAPLDAWYEARAWPSPDGLAVYFVDISARKAAQQEVERAARRSALLARLTAELTGTLDTREAVGRLASLAVPDLADWCVVTLVEDDIHPDWRRRLHDIGFDHVDPAAHALLQEYAEVRIPVLTDDSLVARALATGKPVVVASGAQEAVTAALDSEEAKELCRQLAPSSVAVVPLPGRGRIVGLFTAFRGAGRPGFTVRDIDTLDEVAIRAGLALDNAQLFTEQRELAEGLQRSMLSAPPQPDHLEVVVRYQPATQAAQVGGDWYDAFLEPTGATMVVIGDVVGHDTAAAAAMGQVRSLLRGIAVYSGGGPADVLKGVDQVMQTLQEQTTATAVVARLEGTLEERAAGVTRLRWANAGHPPPMVLSPDGTVVVLDRNEPDVMLGLDPAAVRLESEMILNRGATVLLYTDGLVERRDQPLSEGLAALERTLSELGSKKLALDELCDETLVRMRPERRDDDVALIAVRLHDEDRPPAS